MKISPAYVISFLIGPTNGPGVSAQLSQAAYTVAVIAVTISILIAVFYFCFRVAGQLDVLGNANTRKRLIGRIRGLQILMGVLLLALVGGISRMRGEPLLPNLLGITVNLLWQAGLLSALRTQKAKLRQLDTNGISMAPSKSISKREGA